MNHKSKTQTTSMYRNKHECKLGDGNTCRDAAQRQTQTQIQRRWWEHAMKDSMEMCTLGLISAVQWKLTKNWVWIPLNNWVLWRDSRIGGFQAKVKIASLIHKIYIYKWDKLTSLIYCMVIAWKEFDTLSVHWLKYRYTRGG